MSTVALVGCPASSILAPRGKSANPKVPYYGELSAVQLCLGTRLQTYGFPGFPPVGRLFMISQQEPTRYPPEPSRAGAH